MPKTLSPWILTTMLVSWRTSPRLLLSSPHQQHNPFQAPQTVMRQRSLHRSQPLRHHRPTLMLRQACNSPTWLLPLSCHRLPLEPCTTALVSPSHSSSQLGLRWQAQARVLPTSPKEDMLRHMTCPMRLSLLENEPRPGPQYQPCNLLRLHLLEAAASLLALDYQDRHFHRPARQSQPCLHLRQASQPNQ